MRIGIVAVLALVAISCGGESPTAPSKNNASGTWTGTFNAGNFAPRAVTLTLTQSGDTATGNWTSAASDWTGTLSGSISNGSFSGTATMSAPNALGIGQRCTGNAALSGAVTVNTMSLSGAGFTGSCTGMPTNVSWVLQR